MNALIGGFTQRRANTSKTVNTRHSRTIRNKTLRTNGLRSFRLALVLLLSSDHALTAWSQLGALTFLVSFVKKVFLQPAAGQVQLLNLESRHQLLQLFWRVAGSFPGWSGSGIMQNVV